MGFLSVIPGRAWAGIGLALVVAFLAWRWDSAAFDRGVAACDAHHAKDLAAHVERAQAEARRIALQDAEIDQGGIPERERIRTVYRDREKAVEKHVPVDCNQCRLSPAGIGLLNDALSNRKSGPADSSVGPGPRSEPPGPGGGRNDGGNSGIIDLRQRQVL